MGCKLCKYGKQHESRKNTAGKSKTAGGNPLDKSKLVKSCHHFPEAIFQNIIINKAKMLVFMEREREKDITLGEV